MIYYISKYPPKVYKVTTNKEPTKKGGLLIKLNGKDYYFYKPHWHATAEEAINQIKEELRLAKISLVKEIEKIETQLNTVIEVSEEEIPIPTRGGVNAGS